MDGKFFIFFHSIERYKSMESQPNAQTKNVEMGAGFWQFLEMERCNFCVGQAILIFRQQGNLQHPLVSRN